MSHILKNPIVTVIVGVIAAGFVLNMAYNNSVPVLSDAAKGFK